MGRQRGVKSWRVLVSPQADLQPSQFTYRGHLVNVPRGPRPPPPPRARRPSVICAAGG
jgi:hypothetical protein